MAVLTSQEAIDGGIFYFGYSAEQYPRVAQGFKLGADSTIESVDVYVSRVGGGSAPVQVTLRIEIDNSGLPSGTLANANASAVWAGTTSTSGTWVTFTFSSGFDLNANTQYHILLKWTTENGTDAPYQWYVVLNTNPYANGNIAQLVSGSWVTYANDDGAFRVNGTSGATTTSTSTSTSTTSTSTSTTSTSTTTTSTSTTSTSTSTTSTSSSTTTTSTSTTVNFIYSVEEI